MFCRLLEAILGKSFISFGLWLIRWGNIQWKSCHWGVGCLTVKRSVVDTNDMACLFVELLAKDRRSYQQLQTGFQRASHFFKMSDFASNVSGSVVISVSIFRQACSTVVWSRLPKN